MQVSDKSFAAPHEVDDLKCLQEIYLLFALFQKRSGNGFVALEVVLPATI